MIILELKNTNFTNIRAIFGEEINKTVVSNKDSFGKKGFKYFIGYEDAKTPDLYTMFLPKMSACRRDFEKTKWMYFFNKRWKIVRKIKLNLGKKSAKRIR